MTEEEIYKGFVKFIIVLVALCIVLEFLTSKYMAQIRFQIGYSQAWSLVKKEKYDKASKKASDLIMIESEGYGSSDRAIFMQLLCDTCRYYSQGKYDSAYNRLCDTDRELRDGEVTLKKKHQDIYDGIHEKIVSLYNDHKAEYEAEKKKRQEEIDALLAEYDLDDEPKVTEYIPYVGMSESQIDNTDLGPHSSYIKDFNIEWINGERYQASMYYWGGSQQSFSFSARCVNGKVYNVHDARDDQSSKSTTSSSNSSSSSKKKKTTTVSPDDHDIDTYYEDYKDEFEDEDDAWDDFEDNDEYWDDY